MNWLIFSFDSLPSTNQWVKDHIESFQNHPFSVIIADEQTQGRGQFGKKWHSPKGKNLYLTFCIVQNNELESLRMTHLLALSASKLLKKWGLTPQIKWPNDILINQKKIAGILCEVVSLEDSFAYILGIGLNVNMTEVEASTIDQPATSLLIETKKESQKELILQEMMQLFSNDLKIFLEKGFQPFLLEFEILQMRNNHKLRKDPRS